MFLGNGVPFLSRKEQPLQCLAYKSMQTLSILLFIFPVKKFSILLLYRFKLINIMHLTLILIAAHKDCEDGLL